MKKFLIFFANEGKYAISIDNIISIDKVEYKENSFADERIKKVPSYPDYIEGVFSYKKRLMPIIDFEYISSKGKIKRHDENKIILLYGRGNDFGILVNDVDTIIELDQSTFVQFYDDYPIYTVEKDEEVYIIPDIEKIINDSDISDVFQRLQKKIL